MKKHLAVIATLASICYAAFCVAPAAVAQGSRKDDVVFNAQGRPMAGATVRVCASNATGQPCSPLASIYSDPGLTQALANPISTDGLGNYTFYASPGRYEIELSGPSITTKQLPNVILPNDPSTPTFTTVTTTSGITAFSLSLSGNLTVSGSAAVTGTLSVGGSPVPSTGTENQWTASQHFKGPGPWRDFTGYMKDPSSGSQVNCARTSSTFPVDATGTITNGSSSLTLSSAADFKNGCGLAILGAGPTSTVPTPASTVTVSSASASSGLVTITTSSAHGLWISTNGPFGQGEGIVVTGCANSNYNGTFPLQGIPTSTTVTYTSIGAGTGSTTGCSATFLFGYAHGITGSTTYKYQVVAIDNNMGYAAATSTLTISNGNSALSLNNYNWLGWPYMSDSSSNPGKGAVAYAIYSDKGLGGAKTCVGVSFTNAYSDFGYSMPCPAFLPINPPASAGAQALNTTIASGAGTTTVTLAASASNSATSVNVYHDNSMFLQSCVNDVITDQIAVSGRFFQGNWGCYIPPSGVGPWDFNGPMPTSISNSNQGGRNVQIQVAGGVRLSTMPWMILQSNYSVLGIGGGAPQGTFNHKSETAMFVDPTVPAGFVIANTAFSTVLSGFGMTQIYGYGVWAGQSNLSSGGPAGISINNMDIEAVNSSTAGGFPVVLDTNVIGLWMNDNVLVGNASGTAPTIYFTITTYSGYTINTAYINNTSSLWHGWRFDGPGGQGSQSGHIGISVVNWVSENLNDPGLIVHDNGPNAPGAGLIPIISLNLNNVNNSDTGVGAVIAEVGNAAQVGVYGGAFASAPNVLLTCVAGTIASQQRACATGGFGINVYNNGGFSGANSGSFGGGITQGNLGVTGGAPGGVQISQPLYLAPNPVNMGGSFFPQFSILDSPPGGLAGTPGGGGSLAANTYCWTVAAVDALGAESDTVEPLCNTVGANGSIAASWSEGGGNAITSQASGFTFYFCSTGGTICAPSQKITGLGPNANRSAGGYFYTFSSTSGAVGGNPNVNPKALFSWISPQRGASCLFCAGANSDEWPLGIGAQPPVGSGINLATAMGMKVGASTFSALPACTTSLEGAFRAVTDSTANAWGATITGSGTNHVLAYCDGTNWTVAAK